MTIMNSPSLPLVCKIKGLLYKYPVSAGTRKWIFLMHLSSFLQLVSFLSIKENIIPHISTLFFPLCLSALLFPNSITCNKVSPVPSRLLKHCLTPFYCLQGSERKYECPSLTYLDNVHNFCVASLSDTIDGISH